MTTKVTSDAPVTGHATLAEALAAVQAKLPTVPKTKTAKVGQQYSYQYADLADVTQAVFPLLAAHGLAFVCRPMFSDHGYVLQGELRHGSSGTCIHGEFPLATGRAQDIGSALTYGRRYLLGCLTGVVTDDDDDGAGAPPVPEGTRVMRPPEPSAPEPQAQSPALERVDEFRKRIAMAANGTQLNEVAAEIAASSLGARERNALRVDFEAKMREFGVG